ncbi:hypothetical protein RhiJN_18727 [Ceratobasidium sp. AG-Ba]|nr:hypothetical protein RhiJN_18727 [Ceratobasidium sp. AG-Ba]
MSHKSNINTVDKETFLSKAHECLGLPTRIQFTVHGFNSSDIQLWPGDVNPERFEKILFPNEDVPNSIVVDKSEHAAENSPRRLEVLPTYIVNTPVFDIPALVSILAALMIYDHSQLRTFAISKLDPLITDPVDRITLSRKYKIDHWEEDALKDLSVRKEPITPREANALGLETFERLARMRNEHLDLKYDRRLRKVQPVAGDLGPNELKDRRTEALLQELRKHGRKLDTIEEAVKEVLLVQNPRI